MSYLKIISASLILAVSLIVSHTVHAENQPSIVMEETSHDFGKVTKGDIVRHEFGFTNKGSSVLQIKEFYLS